MILTKKYVFSITERKKQKENMADMVDFFRREVRSFDARITAGVYSDGKIAKEISNWDSTNVDSIIADINTFSAPCGEPKIQDAFHHFVSDLNKIISILNVPKFLISKELDRTQSFETFKL